MSVPYSSNEELELADLWMAGVGVREIGRRLSGRSGATVYAKAMRMGLPPQPGAVRAPVEAVRLEFEELQDIPLAPSQRKVMATLLAAHPFGLTHKEIGNRVFDDTIIDPQGNAVAVCRRLDEKLKRFGWRCCPTGDRKGVKLHPVKGDAA